MRKSNRLQWSALIFCGLGLASWALIATFEAPNPDSQGAEKQPVPVLGAAKLPAVDHLPSTEPRATQRMSTEPFSESVERQETLSAAREAQALNPGRSVSGWVTDAEGVGVPNARVSLRGLVTVSGGTAPSGARSWAQTGPDGAFRTELPLGQTRARVYVDADRYRLERAIDVDLGTAGVTVKMQRLAGLEGRIDFGDIPAFLAKRLTIEVTARRPGMQGNAGAGLAILTPKPNGLFYSGALPEDAVDLHLKARHGAPALHVIENVQVQAGDHPKDPRLNPLHLADVVGAVKLRVVDESGEALKGASIALADPADPANWPIQAITKADGIWQGLFSYKYPRVLVRHRNYAATELDLRHGEMTATLYALHPVDIVLTGITHTGAPYVSVRLRSKDGVRGIVPDYPAFTSGSPAKDLNPSDPYQAPSSASSPPRARPAHSQRFLVPGPGVYSLDLELRSAKGPFA